MRSVIRIIFVTSALVSAWPAFSASRWYDSTHDWTGFYAGINAGYDWGHSDLQFQGGPGNAFNTITGVQIGLEGGYNKQFGHFVVGAEASAATSDLNGDRPCPNPSFTCSAKLNGMFDVAGRAGYALGDDLLYARGGLGMADFTHQFPRIVGTMASDKDTFRHGYLVGAGSEYGFSQSFSAKLEYNYINFGDLKSMDNFNEVIHDKVITNVVKIGLNYKFD